VLWRELQPAVLRYFEVAAAQAAEDLAELGKRSRNRSSANKRESLPVLMCLGRLGGRRALRWRRQTMQQRSDLSIGIASGATQGPQAARAACPPAPSD
jgi:hypothetical protein